MWRGNLKNKILLFCEGQYRNGWLRGTPCSGGWYYHSLGRKGCVEKTQKSKGLEVKSNKEQGRWQILKKRGLLVKGGGNSKQRRRGDKSTGLQAQGGGRRDHERFYMEVGIGALKGGCGLDNEGVSVAGGGGRKKEPWGSCCLDMKGSSKL